MMRFSLSAVFALALLQSSLAQNRNATFDDTDSSIVYSSSPAWNTDVWAEQVPPPWQGTNHGTPNPGATATITFTGNAIWVYGLKEPDHGLRSFTIDSERIVQCDGTTGQLHGRALLFFVDGLAEGEHRLVIEHTGALRQWLNIDYFDVQSLIPPSSDSSTPSSETGSSTPNSNTGSPTPTSAPSGHSPVPIAAIAGGSAGGGALLVIVLGLLIFCILRRRRRRRGASTVNQEEPKAGLRHPADPRYPMLLAPNSPSPPPSTSYYSSGVPSMYQTDHRRSAGFPDRVMSYHPSKAHSASISFSPVLEQGSQNIMADTPGRSHSAVADEFDPYTTASSTAGPSIVATVPHQTHGLRKGNPPVEAKNSVPGSGPPPAYDG